MTWMWRSSLRSWARRLRRWMCDFDAVTSLGMHQRNGNQIRYLLARMAAWLETQCGGTLTFADFVSRARKHPFEIEHIWANHPEQHPELPSEQAFADQRNKFGGLLLLPKDFNASYGDKPYADKLEHYFGQNLLAKSLHPTLLRDNPTFLRLARSTDCHLHRFLTSSRWHRSLSAKSCIGNCAN